MSSAWPRDGRLLVVGAASRDERRETRSAEIAVLIRSAPSRRRSGCRRSGADPRARGRRGRRSRRPAPGRHPCRTGSCVVRTPRSLATRLPSESSITATGPALMMRNSNSEPSTRVAPTSLLAKWPLTENHSPVCGFVWISRNESRSSEKNAVASSPRALAQAEVAAGDARHLHRESAVVGEPVRLVHEVALLDHGRRRRRCRDGGESGGGGKRPANCDASSELLLVGCRRAPSEIVAAKALRRR